MMISAVPKEAVNVVWADVNRVMQDSVETSNGKFHIDDLYHGIQTGLYSLWVIMEEEKVIAAITTRVIEYPGRKALAMDWLGGSKMNPEYIAYRMELDNG